MFMLNISNMINNVKIITVLEIICLFFIMSCIRRLHFVFKTETTIELKLVREIEMELKFNNGTQFSSKVFLYNKAVVYKIIQNWMINNINQSVLIKNNSIYQQFINKIHNFCEWNHNSKILILFQINEMKFNDSLLSLYRKYIFKV